MGIVLAEKLRGSPETRGITDQTQRLMSSIDELAPYPQPAGRFYSATLSRRILAEAENTPGKILGEIAKELALTSETILTVGFLRDGAKLKLLSLTTPWAGHVDKQVEIQIDSRTLLPTRVEMNQGKAIKPNTIQEQAFLPSLLGMAADDLKSARDRWIRTLGEERVEYFTKVNQIDFNASDRIIDVFESMDNAFPKDNYVVYGGTILEDDPRRIPLLTTLEINEKTTEGIYHALRTSGKKPEAGRFERDFPSRNGTCLLGFGKFSISLEFTYPQASFPSEADFESILRQGKRDKTFTSPLLSIHPGSNPAFGGGYVFTL